MGLCSFLALRSDWHWIEAAGLEQGEWFSMLTLASMGAWTGTPSSTMSVLIAWGTFRIGHWPQHSSTWTRQ